MQGRIAITAGLLWAILATCPAHAEESSEEEQDSPRRVVRVKFGFAPLSWPPLTFEVEFSSTAADDDAMNRGETATVEGDLKTRSQEQWPGSPKTFPAATKLTQTAEVGSFVLDGYCAVSLFDQQDLHPSQRRWIKGNKRWGARHEGQVYLFAGPDEQRKFLANPNRYAPVLQGFDPVMVLDRQQKVPGKRKHGVYFDGRIYLFANEDTLKHFSTNPDRYKDIPPSKLLAATIPSKPKSEKPVESSPPSLDESEPAIVEKESPTRNVRRVRLQVLRRLRR